MKRLFVIRGDTEVGPLAFDEAMNRLRAGEFKLDDFGRIEGMTDRALLRVLLPKLGPPLPGESDALRERRSPVVVVHPRPMPPPAAISVTQRSAPAVPTEPRKEPVKGLIYQESNQSAQLEAKVEPAIARGARPSRDAGAVGITASEVDAACHNEPRERANRSEPQAQEASPLAAVNPPEVLPSDLTDKVVIRDDSAAHGGRLARRIMHVASGWIVAGTCGSLITFLLIMLASSRVKRSPSGQPVPATSPTATPFQLTLQPKNTRSPAILPTDPAQRGAPSASSAGSVFPVNTTAVPTTPNITFARRDKPYQNSLGMEFVPVNGTGALLSIWDTRAEDYDAFALATSRKWNRPNFQKTSAEPAVNVNWYDANTFCEWLTQKERQEGHIAANQRYRLPTEMEWQCAAGLDCEGDGRRYAWGNEWPPPSACGNYSPAVGVDRYQYTSPVGIFPPNTYGFFDIGGNVRQWCDNMFDLSENTRVQRGSSWNTNLAELLALSFRMPAQSNSASAEVGFRCAITTFSRNRRTWQAAIGDFVRQFVITNQGHDVDADAAFYASDVNYFDEGVKDQSYIRADIDRYNGRWPNRHDSVGGDIHVSEVAPDKEYTAEFNLNFYADSPERKTWTTGQFNINLDIFVFDNSPKIVAIKERVLRQDRGSLEDGAPQGGRATNGENGAANASSVVITAPEKVGLNLRAEPHAKARVLRKLKTNDRLTLGEGRILNSKPSPPVVWQKVITIDGLTGWINADYITPLTQAEAAQAAQAEAKTIRVNVIRKTYLRVLDDRWTTLFEGWVRPTDGEISFSGDKLRIFVTDSDAVEITKGGKPISDNDDSVTIEHD